MAALLAYDFAGNIRELENIIEHCFVLCSGDIIEATHLPPFLKPTPSVATGEQDVRTLEQMEKMMIIQTLRQHNGNRTAAAKALGIDPSTLFRKLKKLNLSD